MDYHPDDFIALVAGIENEGGAILPDKCEGEKVVYKLPDADRIVMQTANCNLYARLAVAYDPTVEVDLELYTEIDGENVRTRIKHNGEDPQQNLNFVPVCAVDDAVGAWPRYAGLCPRSILHS